MSIESLYPFKHFLLPDDELSLFHEIGRKTKEECDARKNCTSSTVHNYHVLKYNMYLYMRWVGRRKHPRGVPSHPSEFGWGKEKPNNEEKF